MGPKRDHKAMEKRRLKAAKLFGEGKTASEVARLLGVRRQSAHEWLQRWESTGTVGLASKGPAGPKSKLSEAQLEALAEDLIAGPEVHGYATALWTLPRVAKLIKDRTGEQYHPGHVSRLLHSLGFSCQRPTRRAIERDEAKIAEWKRVEWPRLKKKPGAKVAPSSSSTRAD